MIKYGETEQFKRDFKKLQKKFSSLPDDLKINKQYRMDLFHLEDIDSNGIFEIQGVGNTEDLKFYKVKKFQCKSLKGRGANSGIRLIYAYIPNEQKVVLIEMYFKAQKENEDKQRINDFLKASITCT